MSTDQARSMMEEEGAVFDGSKVERELGLIYTLIYAPIREALEEEIASYRR